MLKFYTCEECKTVKTEEEVKGLDISKLTEVIPNTTEAALEKHLPVVTVSGNKVKVSVGEVIHPMTEEHFINFIILETNKGTKKAELKPGQEPTCEFELSEGEEPIAVYEYCNLHGIWKKAI